MCAAEHRSGQVLYVTGVKKLESGQEALLPEREAGIPPDVDNRYLLEERKIALMVEMRIIWGEIYG